MTFTGAALAQISVVSSATSSPSVAPGSIATLYGTGLASQQTAATLGSNGSLPVSLAGTSVAVNGEMSPLLFVSPAQINFVIPSDAPNGTVNVTITTPGGTQTGTAQIQQTAPGLFTIPCLRPDRAAAENAVTGNLEPFNVTTSQNPGSDKTTILSIYGTGIRGGVALAGNSSAATATGVTSAQFTDANGNNYPANVLYAGIQPSFAGLDQINLTVPAALQGLGIVHLSVNVGGQFSNTVSVDVSQVASTAAAASQLTIATIGSTTSTTGGAGAAVQSQLMSPSAVALDANHNLYIADSGNHVVRRVDTNGVMSVFAGTGTAGSSGDGGPAAQAELRRPVALAFDSQGFLYIADADDNSIRVVNANGTISNFAGAGTAGFSGDSGPATAAQLNAPGGISINPYGTLLIADTGNNRVRRVTSDGLISTVAGAGAQAGSTSNSNVAYNTTLKAPSDVAVDSEGTVFVADAGNYIIRRITPDGSIFTIGGNGMQGSSGTNCPALQASFRSPMRLAVDATGNLLVSDTSNDEIRVIDPACYLTTAAGTGAAGFGGDGGNATQAELNSPAGLAVDATGQIYFADSSNGRIRELSQPVGSSVAFSPAAAQPNAIVHGYVTLATPASAPTQVQLTTSTPIPNLPAFVTVATGQTTAAFSLTAPSASAAMPVTISLSGPGINGSGSFTVAPSALPAGLASDPPASSLSILPASIPAGGSAVGRITLAGPAPAGGTAVQLGTSSPAVTVAPSVTIPQGRTAGEFLISSNAMPSSPASVATINASAGGTGVTASLAVGPGSSAPAPSSAGTIGVVSFVPATVTGGQASTGTVTLQSRAGSGGVSVGLSSNSSAVTVPANVSVPAGAASATFPVSTTPVSMPMTATVTASSANNVSGTIGLTAAQPGSQVSLGGISISPATLTAGQPATGTVTLSSPAPAGGAAVTLESTVPGVTVPPSMSIPAGQTSGTFTVQTGPTASGSGSISASSQNLVSTSVTVGAGSGSGTGSGSGPGSGSGSGTGSGSGSGGSGSGTGQVSSITLSSNNATGGQSVTGTANLAAPAGTGGARVQLSSSNTAAAVPSSIAIPQGQSSGTFQISTQPVSSNTTATITGTSGSSSASAMLTVAAPCPSNLSLQTNVTNLLTGSGVVTGNLDLNGLAPPGGTPVNISTGAGSLGTVLVPAGQSSAPIDFNLGNAANLIGSPATATVGSCTAVSALL